MNTTETFTPVHLKPWKRPSYYIGATWEGWYVVIGRTRDSDALERANFDEALEQLEPLKTIAEIDGEEMATVQHIQESHWACGWVAWIGVHSSNIHALKLADELKAKINDYPCLNEERWSNYEHEEAMEIWQNCYDATERIEYIRKHRSQFGFRSFADLLACVRGKHFAGYASELCAR